MSMTSELYAYFKTKTTITDIFGTSDNCRIYAHVAPSSATFPYAVWNIISADHIRHMTAASGIVETTLQIDVSDNDMVGLNAAADAFRVVLDGLDQTTLTAVTINGTHLANERSDVNDILGQEGGTHQRQLDFTIWHTESIPTFPAT